MIMLNNINEIDESFVEDTCELFSTPCEACEGTGKDKEDKDCSECGGQGTHDNEFYQYYLTDITNKYEINRLKEYGVFIGYSDQI